MKRRKKNICRTLRRNRPYLVTITTGPMFVNRRAMMYLSFCGEEGFRGAVFVNGEDILAGVMEANRLGINPHGEVMGVEIPAEAAGHEMIQNNKNRLLSRDDMEALGLEPVRVGDME